MAPTQSRGSERRRFWCAVCQLAAAGDVCALGELCALADALAGGHRATARDIEVDIKARWFVTMAGLG